MNAGFEERSAGEARAFVCRPLEDAGFLNAFSSRPGGVSPFPIGALNLSYLGDDAANVEENRRRFLRAAALPSYPLVTVRQTHSTLVVEASAKTAPETEGDALFSRDPGVYVGVKTADCVPILLADPKTGATAAVHAGWKGAADNILAKAVSALARAGARPADLVAAVGPAACGLCFEVGNEIADRFKAIGAGAALTPTGERALLDIPAVCALQLQAAGVPADRIHQSALCTMHEEGLFFSHRREAKDGKSVGRLLSVIGRKA